MFPIIKGVISQIYVSLSFRLAVAASFIAIVCGLPITISLLIQSYNNNLIQSITLFFFIYSIVVSATASDAPPLQYLAP